MRNPDLSPKQLGLLRLQELALLLEDSPHRYEQENYVHDCRTPACALGHWALAHPERWSLTDNLLPFLRDSGGVGLCGACDEFSITMYETCELFGLFGCNRARTAKQAAAYIRAFVVKKEWLMRQQPAWDAMRRKHLLASIGTVT